MFFPLPVFGGPGAMCITSGVANPSITSPCQAQRRTVALFHVTVCCFLALLVTSIGVAPGWINTVSSVTTTDTPSGCYEDEIQTTIQHCIPANQARPPSREFGAVFALPMSQLRA